MCRSWSSFPSALIGRALADGLAPFRAEWRRWLLPAACYVAAFAAVLAYGFAARVDTGGDREWKVALVQQNVDPWKNGYSAYRTSLNVLKKQSDQATLQKPEIIIWSETSFVPSISWHTQYRTDLQMYDIVKELRDYLAVQKLPFVVGNNDGQLKRVAEGREERVDYNAALLMEGDRIVDTYRKIHLVPFTESFPFQATLPAIYTWLKNADTHFWEDGTVYTVFQEGGVRFSTPICFEDTFGDLCRRFVDAGADVLVNLTNDAWSFSVARRDAAHDHGRLPRGGEPALRRAVHQRRHDEHHRSQRQDPCELPAIHGRVPAGQRAGAPRAALPVHPLGRLAAVAAPGRVRGGSCRRVRAPRPSALEGAQLTGQRNSVSIDPEAGMKLRGRILIVDDEPINLEFFDVMLSKLGFQVEKAVDGEEALEKVQACNPDLIILDNIMPKLSGWEVTRMLKHEPAYRRWRNTPIIMFSAMNEVKDRIEGFEQGVDDYITKPFNFSEVLARIRAVLRSRELSRQLNRRERRIAVVESLNNSLVFFTQHIKKPISDILTLAETSDPSAAADMEKLVALVRREGGEILATLRGLEDEVAELQGKGEKLRRGDLSVDELEKKLRKHLKNWKKRQEKLSGEEESAPQEERTTQGAKA